MEVWIVFMHCGICGDFEWGGVFSKESAALRKQDEMNDEYEKQFHRHLAECDKFEVDTDDRVRKAFDMIAKANTVSILSLDEMERVVNRALAGEFDGI